MKAFETPVVNVINLQVSDVVANGDIWTPPSSEDF